MSKEVLLITQFQINQGMQNEFKALFKKNIETVEQKEPEISRFNLYVNEDETIFHTVELYDNATAMVKHLERASERINKIMNISKVINVTVYGPLTDEAKKLLLPYGTMCYSYGVGYQR